jgi:hypothetical protein
MNKGDALVFDGDINSGGSKPGAFNSVGIGDLNLDGVPDLYFGNGTASVYGAAVDMFFKHILGTESLTPANAFYRSPPLPRIVRIIPDFTHLYAKDGYGCDDYGQTFSIPFKIINGSSAGRVTPRATVAICGRDRETDPWRCSRGYGGTLSPEFADLSSDQEASFTFTTGQGSIRGGDYYRYSFSVDGGNTVVSEVTASACQF